MSRRGSLPDRLFGVLALVPEDGWISDVDLAVAALEAGLPISVESDRIEGIRHLRRYGYALENIYPTGPAKWSRTPAGTCALLRHARDLERAMGPAPV